MLVIGLAQMWHFSALLAAITLGFSARFFLRSAGDRLFAPIEYFEELVFILFFTIAGAHFQPAVFLHHLDLIFVYFIARIAGKVAGASLGARICNAPAPVVRWLGLGLVPQAGIAVALALTLSHVPTFKDAGTLIVNVILATTLMYELLRPFLTWYALKQAGVI